jgi:hypothetical protein
VKEDVLSPVLQRNTKESTGEEPITAADKSTEVPRHIKPELEDIETKSRH